MQQRLNRIFLLHDFCGGFAILEKNFEKVRTLRAAKYEAKSYVGLKIPKKVTLSGTGIPSFV